MINFDITNTHRLIDVSMVKTAVSVNELNQMIEAAKMHRFFACFAMPCYTEYLSNAIEAEPDIICGGVVGFPSGTELTSEKIQIAKDMLSFGCQELDMVINVSALISGLYDQVYDDIRAIVEIAGNKPVKAIIEQCYLTDDEICRASEIAAKAGVAYVKTGTGWGPKPTTVETIKMIKRTVGNSVRIKAAGGIRSLDTIIEMYNEGCERFGISTAQAVKIMEEVEERLATAQ